MLVTSFLRSARGTNNGAEETTEEEPETPCEEVDNGEDEDERVKPPTGDLEALLEALIRVHRRPEYARDEGEQAHGEQNDKCSSATASDHGSESTEHKRETAHEPAGDRQHKSGHGKQRKQESAPHEPPCNSLHQRRARLRWRGRPKPSSNT